ncbi:C4-dicarboxylate ABC transporter [uncultured Duncaniella sp.]|uniref:C4-dicarboxylate ABC transporter n=1 Tax=uncultured Duncaniella sp. TaxID=2768039 RepID=UPI0025A95BE9|nr:C4-dicarboxylate ABC transporter [uncultured Duncaniella sp.]
MALNSGTESLRPLEKCSVQPYFSNSLQLAGIIEWILQQSGPADIMISTFSTSEEFLRRISRLRNSGMVLSCSLFCDLRAARKTVALYHFICGVFDSVALCQNHSKVVLIYNDSLRVAVVTSQNQTRGDRFEAGIITTDTLTFNNLRLGFDLLAENAMPIDVLLTGKD